MKKIKLTGRLNLNKITVSELNNQENVTGGARGVKSDRFACLDTYMNRTCETMTMCDTYPCCLTHTCTKIVSVNICDA